LEHHSSNWGDFPAPLRAWRTEDWKYVESPSGGEELYDLRADPLERRNLIDDPTAAEPRQRLRHALYAWMEQTADPWPDVPVPSQLVRPRAAPSQPRLA
jgi:arylsulfatase A-like enzyme